MKRIDITPIEIDLKEYEKRDALLSDVSKHLNEDCIIYVDNEPVLVYKVLDPSKLKNLRWAVKNIKYDVGERTLGLKSTSKVFGYSPRLTLRYDFCRLSGMGNDFKKQHKVITDFGIYLTELYEEFLPEDLKRHREKVYEKVIEEWVIDETPFTSGIVNKNNRLKYHFDSGNFKGVYSNMVVLKRDVDGGHLVIPSLDISLECSDGALVIFNGQDILHGVSGIEYQHKDAYRYSAVYYSLEQMWKCEPLDDELRRIREVKTEREKKRIDPEHIKKMTKIVKGRK